MSYLFITLSWLPAFYLGHLSFKLLKPYKQRLFQYPANVTSLQTSCIGVILFVVLILFAYIGRSSILGGYESYDQAARGKISTLLVLYNFFLIYQLISRQKVSFLIVLGTLITAILLLSMGGRMYVMQTFIVFLIYKTSFAPRRWKLGKILVFGVTGFLIASFVGIWRMGGNFSVEKAIYSLLAEPVFTWFSTSSFLVSNDIPLINIPLNFLTSFFNLIPNTLISLSPYMVSPSSMTKGYASPLGADSVWSTLIINFGSVGSIFFIYITGFILNFLRHNSEKSRFGAVYYVMVCGMLPFQFFRDGFYLLNKQLFFNFLLLPGIILITLRFLFYHPSQEQALKPKGVGNLELDLQ